MTLGSCQCGPCFLVDRAPPPSPTHTADQSGLLEICLSVGNGGNSFCWGEIHKGESFGGTDTERDTLSPMTFSLELFAAPVLSASLSSPFLEGSPVTLSCETKLLVQSPGLQLYFSFYVGSKILEDRNTSSEYHIPSVGSEDSGLYWCEVATADGSVLKHSLELELRTFGECAGSGGLFLPVELTGKGSTSHFTSGAPCVRTAPFPSRLP